MNCPVCRKLIALSDLLKCGACKKQFHYQCLNITCAKYLKLYSTKNQWKCDSCTNVTVSRGKNLTKNTQAGGASCCVDKACSSSGKISEKPEISKTDRIIKYGQSPLLSSNSMENLSTNDLDKSSTLLDTTARSLPNTTQMNDSLVHNLKDQISTLSIDLNSAHEEIITLNEQNTKLKLEVQELKKKITLVTKISSSITTSTPVSHHPALNLSSTQKKPKKQIVFGKSASTQKSSPKANSPMKNGKDIEPTPDQNINIVTVEENTNSEPVPSSSHKAESKDNEEAMTVMKRIKRLPPPKMPLIYILGDEGATGIAQKLSNLRYKNNFNKNFRVSAFVKPQALYSEILGDFKELITRVTKDDIIIIILGSNKNASSIKLDVENFLEKNDTKNVVFLCEIERSNYLNPNKRNNTLKSVINKFHLKHVTEMHTQLDLAIKLNIEIDYLRYMEEFITNFGKHVRARTVPQTSDILKVGTIPYYFHQQKLKREKKHLELNSKIPKMGTIPYYFSKKTTTTSSTGGFSKTEREVFFRDHRKT